MNIRDDDQVSAIALVVESEAPTAASVADEPEASPMSDVTDVTDADEAVGDDFADQDEDE
jgi:hypothetical protein